MIFLLCVRVEEAEMNLCAAVVQCVSGGGAERTAPLCELHYTVFI